MYLHIGKDYVIDENNIIGIFNMEAIKKSREYEHLYENIKDNIVDISGGVQKTLILVKNKNTKGYITNISSTTLKKREV